MSGIASRWCSASSSARSPGREHPLALFLDDLQWLDAATLEVLERLVTDPECGTSCSSGPTATTRSARLIP